ncbi:unnamed protein product, partial [Mesorhabditis spiculigera]
MTSLLWNSVEKRLAAGYASKQDIVRTEWMKAYLKSLDEDAPIARCLPAVVKVNEQKTDPTALARLSDEQGETIRNAYAAAQTYDGVDLDSLHQEFNDWETKQRPFLLGRIEELRQEVDVAYKLLIGKMADKSDALRAVKTGVEALENEKRQVLGQLKQPTQNLPMNMLAYLPVEGVDGNGRLVQQDDRTPDQMVQLEAAAQNAPSEDLRSQPTQSDRETDAV